MDPFAFVWAVDQDGYEIERVTAGNSLFGGLLAGPGEFDVVAGQGGPLRYYRPLDDDGLWLRFAETCRTPEGALLFANEYGGLGSWMDQNGTLKFYDTPVNDFLNTAKRLWEIATHLREGNRTAAAEVFRENDDILLWGYPLMRVALIPSTKPGGGFEYKFVPQSLRDALLHQAVEAISGNRRFQRCRNEHCSNWFRLGPHSAKDGGKTYTARREFCSDRCRVATSRRLKKGEHAHA